MFLSITSLFFLIPEEEALPPSPQIYKPTTSTYDFAEVLRGDLIDSAKITCEYNAIREDSLGFLSNGILIENIYVELGDMVEEGDILAELYMGDLQTRLDGYNNQLQLLNLELQHVKDTRDLEYDNHVNYLKTLSDEELSKAMTAAEKVSGYQSQIDTINDEIYIESLRKSEVEEDIKGRQIIATIDGIVTYVRNIENNERSDKNFTIVKVADDDTSAFIGTYKLDNLFEIGEIVEMEIEDEIYDAQVISSEEFGVTNEEGDRFYYYFKLVEPQIFLTNDSKGVVEVIINQRLDVLYLPENALRVTQGKDAVYYQNDDGIRELKFVETGLVVDRNVEIISGVNQGELIILE